MEKQEFDAVVLCNGSFPEHNVALRVLHGARYLCCCDGAAQQCAARGIVPDAVVGDGDSLPPALRQRFAGVLHIVGEQEYNDMTKATRFCMERGARRIAYVGATGLREDHTLGNISLLAYYRREFGIEVAMFTDHGCFVAAGGRTVFGSFEGQQVSIFNMGCSKIESEGLRWPCYAYRELWQGTLNEATGPQFVLDGDGGYIVYQTYEAKVVH